ncbi:MAG: tetratricopeptide repeat protein [Candidatus Sumerlaeota bacterium]|nr:tetratricopeptide repeat protein [Candidatus Sumerlaeota bacterium]
MTDLVPYESLLPYLGLLILVLAVFFPALGAGFIWDDTAGIRDNFLLRSLRGLWTIWSDPAHSPLGNYFPLTFTTFWVERRVWGTDPWGYHLVNILLHAGNAALLYRLLDRLGVRAAWLAAALFAVHPVQTASVAWVIERKNVLCGLFYLLSFWAWLDREKRGWGAYGLSLALYTCAVLSKSIAATLPVGFLLCLWWKKGRVDRKAAMATVPFLVVGGALGAVEWLVQAGAQPDRGLSIVAKCLIAGRAFWFYVGKLLWPLNLMQVYPQWPIDTRQAGQYLYPLAAVAAFAALWAARRRLGRGPFAAAAFYAVTLSPILGFVENSVMDYSYVHDHHQYLACIGVFALAAAGLDRIAVGIANAFNAPAASWRPALFGLALAVLGFLSWKQTLLYKDMETLFRDNMKKNPAAWPAYTNVGTALLEKGDLDEAEGMFRKALSLKPRCLALHNLASALNREGRSAEALEFADKALETRPGDCAYLNNKGRILAQLGRFDEAFAAFQQALSAQPLFTEARANLACVLVETGRIEEGKAILTQILQSEPDCALARADLGLACVRQGEFREAVAHFREALRLDPSMAQAANNLAWILAAGSSRTFAAPMKPFDGRKPPAN